MKSQNYFLKKNFDFLEYNSMRIKSACELIVFPINEAGLKEIYKDFPKEKKIILGAGTNIIFSKEYYYKNYVFISLRYLSNISYKNNYAFEVQAGALLHDICWKAVYHETGGFEFLEDIPSTLGGAIYMNAGTHNDEISNLIHTVKYFDPEDLKINTFKKSECGFKERKSIFQEKNYIIIETKLVGFKKDQMDIINALFKIKMERFSKQPRNLPNAGSVFYVNSYQSLPPIWKMVNDAGLRGFSVGPFQVSEKHTNFIVHHGGGNFRDLERLINIVVNKIYEKYGVKLCLEWRII